MMVNGKEERVYVTWIEDVLILLWLTCGRGSEQMQVAFVQSVEVPAPSDMFEGP